MTTEIPIPVEEGNNNEYKVGYKRPPKKNQWKPGQSGNPAGRPKDPGITVIQEGMLDVVCPYDAKGRTWRVWLAERGLLQASEGNFALENLKNRLEGKVPETHKIEGDIPVSIVYKLKESEGKE